MSALTMIDPAVTTGETKELLDGLRQRLGRIPNMIRVMAHSPTVLRAYLDFTFAMQHTTVSAALRNQLALVVAETSGSRYFLSLAEALARRDGLSEEDIAHARRTEARDPRAAAALRFAARAVRERGAIPQEAITELRAAGFTDEQVVEIVALVGLNVFRSDFNLALDTEVDARPARANA